MGKKISIKDCGGQIVNNVTSKEYDRREKRVKMMAASAEINWNVTGEDKNKKEVKRDVKWQAWR